jgi:hypothetical protein
LMIDMGFPWIESGQRERTSAILCAPQHIVG